MRKYGFVVLNYNNSKDTIECVNSILNITSNDYEVVIVDNNSTDDSLSKIKDVYSGKIKIIESDRNGGYSYGNNLGIKYLLNNGVQHVCIATNDTLLNTKNIIDILDDLIDSSVGLIGPEIKTLEGRSDNPVLKKISILYLLNLFCFSSIKAFRDFLYTICPSLSFKRKSYLEDKRITAVNNQDVYMIHGCFLIITKYYLDEVGLLDEDLFMYGEEDLLSYFSKVNNLRVIYNNQISVIHKEEGSTKIAHNKNKDKFRAEMELKSKQVLRNKINKLNIIRQYLKQVF